MKMTHRERVVTALNHQEPDYVPIDLGCGSSTTMVAEGYEQLKSYLGIESQTEVLNKAFRLAKIDERILKMLDIDTRGIGIKRPRNWTQPPAPEGAPEGTWVDEWGIVWRPAQNESGFYYEVMRSPLAEATIDDLEAYPWPDPWDPGRTEGLVEEIDHLYNQTDYAIVGDCGFKSLWEVPYLLRGYERLLEELYLDRDFVHALLRNVIEINKAAAGRFLDVVGPYIQVLRMGDDLGTQRGPLFSPRLFREVLKPYFAEYISFVKQRTSAKIFFHTCGNVVPLLEDLIEVGVDILNPVQVSANDMDTKRLKALAGDRLSFWGAIDTQHVLPQGTVDDVKREVEQRITDLAPRGGYVVGPVHNIQPDVPSENVLAMYRHAREVGRYPLATRA